MEIIDLRSDTVTQPCEAMKRVMFDAPTGDDVYREDPTVIKLQETLSAMTGHEAGLFFPSGVQSNLVALLSHCQRGDEYIVAQHAHTYKFEGGGAAALGGIQPQPIERERDGTLDLVKVKRTIKTDDIHFAKTKLLALENTTTSAGAVSADYMIAAAELCAKHGIQMHLDGARVFNAAAEFDIDVKQLTAMFDTVSICLSKGLGAPVGSVLCGSTDFIEKAIRWRKTVGGGMRQSGIVAAAGLFAINNNVSRLKQDHDLAKYLAAKLKQFEDIEIMYGGAQTNMVFFGLKSERYDELLDFGKNHGVLFGGRQPIRMVAHKDVGESDIDLAIDRLNVFFNR